MNIVRSFEAQRARLVERPNFAGLCNRIVQSVAAAAAFVLRCVGERGQAFVGARRCVGIAAPILADRFGSAL
jgi:hypothetical protein